jgi:hypothetical protein
LADSNERKEKKVDFKYAMLADETVKRDRWRCSQDLSQVGQIYFIPMKIIEAIGSGQYISNINFIVKF